MQSIAKRIEKIIEEKRKQEKDTTPSRISLADGLERAEEKKKPSCPICKDEWFVIDKNDPWKAVPCQCREQQVLKKRMRGSLLPEEFEHATFENFKIYQDHQRRLYQAAKSYLREFETIRHEKENSIGFLAKVGELDLKNNIMDEYENSYGIGKTHIQMAMAKELIRRGYSVVCISDADFMDRLSIARTTDGYEKEYYDLLDSVMECDVLVWDDLGQSNISEANHRRYNLIINHRCIHKKPIIFSSNESLKTLDRKIGRRAWSRLIGMCRRYTVPLSGPDYRVQTISENPQPLGKGGFL